MTAINIKNTNHPKSPSIRFKEFSQPWEEKKLGEIGERITRKNKENNQNVLTISAQYGLISQIDFFNKIVAGKNLQNYYLLEKNDFAYNKSYSAGYPMGATKRLTLYEKGIVSTLYICFRFKNIVNNDFASQYFESGKHNSEIEKIAQEGARNHGLLNIGINDYFETKLFFPSLKEQTKIAHFLSKLDERISTQMEVIEDLKRYKQGLMQQIFSQKIRFKNDNGEDFPDWEERKLGEVLKEPTQIPEKNIESIELLSVKLHCKGIENTGKFPVITKKGRPYYKRLKNELLIGRQNFHNGGIGIVREKNHGKICSNAITSYNVIKDNLHFIYFFISREEYYKKVNDLIGGTGQKELSKAEFSKLKIFIPSLKEQQKIANLLSKLDEKIENEEQVLENYKQQKSYFLKNMFV